jgi:hypothetical protein
VSVEDAMQAVSSKHDFELALQQAGMSPGSHPPAPPPAEPAASPEETPDAPAAAFADARSL